MTVSFYMKKSDDTEGNGNSVNIDESTDTDIDMPDGEEVDITNYSADEYSELTQNLMQEVEEDFQERLLPLVQDEYGDY